MKDDSSIAPGTSHPMGERGNVLNRVGHQQDKWKRQVREQRRNIYDRHTMLNWMKHFVVRNDIIQVKHIKFLVMITSLLWDANCLLYHWRYIALMSCWCILNISKFWEKFNFAKRLIGNITSHGWYINIKANIRTCINFISFFLV